VKNVTVSLPDEVYRKARIKAAERNTSLSAMVKEFLESLADDEGEFKRLERLLEELYAHIERFRGSDRLTREELYRRGNIRWYKYSPVCHQHGRGRSWKAYDRPANPFADRSGFFRSGIAGVLCASYPIERSKGTAGGCGSPHHILEPLSGAANDGRALGIQNNEDVRLPDAFSVENDIKRGVEEDP
jgi:hypothetical protein